MRLGLTLGSVLFLLPLISTTGCKSSTADSPSVGGLSFGTAQSDSQGYEGHQWGSKSVDGLQASSPMSDYDIFVKAVGPPGSVINGEFVESNETSPRIQTYTNSSNTVDYGYYDGGLAFAVARIEGSFSETAGNLASKYGQGVEIAQESAGDGKAPAIWNGYNFAGVLYKRGSTNTRIYLMHELKEGGEIGDTYVLYVPNAELLAVRNAWWNRFTDQQNKATQQQSQAAAAAQQRDQQKIQ